MKINRPIADSKIERQIITGMIISTKFLMEIQPILNLSSFQLKFSKTVAEWCLDYYTKYKIAPQKNIESIFLSFKSSLLPEKIEMISVFLESISEEYKRTKHFNVEYILDNAEKYFRTVALKQAEQKIKEYLAKGELEEGEKIITGFRRLMRHSNIGVDPVFDLKEIRNALSNDSSNNMFSLSGDLGKLIGSFQREWLVTILGNSGIGKTWWLLYIAMKATLAGYNVVFASLEMSQEEIIRRIQSYIHAMPIKEYEDGVIIPVFDCISNQDNSCDLKYRVCNVGLSGETNISLEDAPEGYIACTKCRYKNNRFYQQTSWFKKVEKGKLKMKNVSSKIKKMERLNFTTGNLKLIHFPMKTISMQKFETYLDNLEYYENFIPDVIVTDYAANFGSNNRHDQQRFNIQEIWEGHKSLAQKRKALVVSGHQGNTVRTGGEVGQGNWAEDLSGLRLSDLSIALNQTPQEKDKGVMRISVTKQRSDNYSLLNSATVLYSYDIGRPYLDSTFTRKNNLQNP